MNKIDLPSFIKDSVVLTADDKNILSLFSHLPSEQEIDEIRSIPEILELTNAFIGDETSRDTHLQLKAREYLTKDDILMAWKILLL